GVRCPGRVRQPLAGVVEPDTLGHPVAEHVGHPVPGGECAAHVERGADCLAGRDGDPSAGVDLDVPLRPPDDDVGLAVAGPDLAIRADGQGDVPDASPARLYETEPLAPLGELECLCVRAD